MTESNDGSADWVNLPNGLSVSRLVIAVPTAWLILNGHWQWAAAAVVLAVATDMADGWIARRFDQTSALGGLLDHVSDASFVTCLLLAEAALGIVPYVLPALVVASFAQYVLDSNALRGAILRSSRIGRGNGIAYFVLAGFPVMQHGLGLYPVDEGWFAVAGWILVASTVISMTDRGYALFRQHSAR